VHARVEAVIEIAHAADLPVGTVLSALPWHICPTVALHDRVHVVRDHRIVDEWQVTARARRLSIQSSRFVFL